MVIDWLSWGKEAFEKSVREGKPILLSIGASWCHWCHVMEEGTYQNEKVIKLLREKFVGVRVDTDERPDVNERYNQGGWPSTVFLTAQGEIITGTTYVPPEQMLDLLEQVVVISRRLTASGQGLIGSNPILPKKIKGSTLMAPDEPSFEEKRLYFIKYKEIFLKKFDDLLELSFDSVYGGFGDSPKFPHVDVLHYCLVQYQKTGRRPYREMLAQSLEAMAEGGLFDHLDGGFFRYSVDRRFEEPHFEKMLADNLKLSRLYRQAAKVLADGQLVQVAERAESFIKNWLFDHDKNVFFASVDAEENYYRLASRRERLEYCHKNQRPRVDKTFYTDLNAQAAESLEDPDLQRSLRQRLVSLKKDPHGLIYHFYKGEQGFVPGLLVDQIAVVKAWLQAPTSGVGRDNSSLPRSIRAKNDGEAVTAGSFWLAVVENLYDEERGGFFDRVPVEGQEFGLLKEPLKPLAENVEAIRLLKAFGQADLARQSLIEIFFSHKTPSLHAASLATLLLES